MTTFQLVMVIIMGVEFLVTIGFAVAFIVDANRKNRVATASLKETKEEEKEEEYDIKEMLAQLESQKEEKEEKEEAPAPVVVVVEEAKEEPAEEVLEEVVEEPAQEEKVEEPAEEEAPKTIIIKEVTTETIGTDFDYNTRLARIVESKDKLEKDLAKTQNSILKYERTERRRERNQKMLDRRAVELTNLNLMMYSVTDIKNIDADKKQKQEELTLHISELKASIQDADEYLAKNREKYEHDKKMLDFYQKELARYNDEVAELETLIKNSNSVTSSTTTTTTTTDDGETTETTTDTTEE